MAEQPSASELLALTSEIVAAHVASNAVAAEEISELIRAVFGSLKSIGDGPRPVIAPRPEPAVPIRRSVASDHIVCLEDGKKLKMLKRYLMSRYNMTPEQYRPRRSASAPSRANEVAVRLRGTAVGRSCPMRRAATERGP
jgi:predicted transcriptional regulator